MNSHLGKVSRIALMLAAGASLAACATITPKYAVRDSEGAGSSSRPPPATPGAHGTNAPYQVAGIWYVPHDQPNYDETGIASWYGDAFNMKATADGEIFDMNQFSAAHTTLPLPSMVEVTNLDNGRKLTVRVNDRGPFVDNRLIDLSHAAAAELGYDRAGLAHVRVRYLGPAPLAPANAGVRVADAGRTSMFTPSYPTRLPPAAPAAASSLGAAAAFAPAAASTASGPIQTASLGPAQPIGAAPLAAPAPVPVSVSALPPLPSEAAAAPAPVIAGPGSAPRLPAAPMQLAEAGGAFRIQAGAFSDEANARRAADQLAPAGKAMVEPIQRGGQTLYRVTVAGPADEAQAYALRDRVAQIGFADARVLQP